MIVPTPVFIAMKITTHVDSCCSKNSFVLEPKKLSKVPTNEGPALLARISIRNNTIQCNTPWKGSNHTPWTASNSAAKKRTQLGCQSVPCNLLSGRSSYLIWIKYRWMPFLPTKPSSQMQCWYHSGPSYRTKLAQLFDDTRTHPTPWQLRSF